MYSYIKCKHCQTNNKVLAHAGTFSFVCYQCLEVQWLSQQSEDVYNILSNGNGEKDLKNQEAGMVYGEYIGEH